MNGRKAGEIGLPLKATAGQSLEGPTWGRDSSPLRWQGLVDDCEGPRRFPFRSAPVTAPLTHSLTALGSISLASSP